MSNHFHAPYRPALLRDCVYPLVAIAGLLVLAAAGLAAEPSPDRLRNLVVLDALGVENLKIETQELREQPFEQVFFAGGRVEAIPSSHAAVSSLKPGQVRKINIAPGDHVEAGAEVVEVEYADGMQVLRSPIAGMVLRVEVIQGEAFRRGKTLMEIVDLREVDVVARLPEHEASLVAVGSSARIRVLAACDKIFKGTLVRFGTEGDRKHGTAEAYYRLQNRDLLMKPGMRAEFRIIAAERKASAVPREAVQGTPTGAFVFIKDYDLPNAFLRVPVVVGQRNDRFAEIVRGLMPGDEVVTRGAYFLSFAGKGSVGLKEALDAAHGHPHHADGTPVDSASGHEGHEQESGHGLPTSLMTVATVFLAVLSVLLAVLLWLSRRNPPVARA